ncbi:MAG: hypothetical protein A2X86_18260 [Bdellovibrionales bacterium GWA2_49_15]|nr:MAG: hypothetical protein A2X86_18260 [Bdellovibrionales bacterium GWA2_49_15]HAZ11668.1 hypothetical protein [Bdellovibrionales bacterium]
MDLKIITSNIRYDDPKDGSHQWSFRQKIWTKCINSFAPHLLGTQEGLHPQIQEFAPSIAPLQIIDRHRTWLVDRMYPNLFYHKDVFELLDSGDIWLSQTPHIPGSLSFNSQFPRLAVWAKLEHKFSHRNFLAINTHLDHLHGETRMEQIAVLLHELQELKLPTDHCFFMGDFNEGPGDGVQAKIFKHYPNLTDPWVTLNKKEAGSHHKFDGKNLEKKRIDWILASETFNITDITFDVSCDNDIYPSDHFPVKLTISF